MNLHHPALLLIASVLLLFAAGCTAAPDEQTGPVTPALSAADEAYARGEAAYATAYYRTAEEHFAEARALYAEAGDTESARQARGAMMRAARTVMEFPLNASAAEAALRESVPGITDDEVRDWLEHRAQRIVSDNETLYFYDVAKNYLYAHPEEMQRGIGPTLDFDFVARYAFSEDRPAGEGPYVNPIHYAGTEKLEIPQDLLPATGMIQIWYPLPVETESQRNITVANLSYADAIVKGPVTTGPIGYVYYEIPAETITGDLTVTADIAFTSYTQIFEIDPAQVGEYNTTDPEYLLYTASERNIEITDAVRAKAREIVGNETNPHLQAEMIYASIIETYPYSHVPHFSLDAREPKVAESTHMFETGHGDCGTQSMLFSAFCRSLGIPARAIGGYQMLLSDAPGAHFWAQYYLPGYGWVPVDPTVADAADRVPISDANRSIFKNYYATNLDPTRLVIQKNVDAPLDPPLPDGPPLFRIVRQYPAIFADMAEADLNLAAMEGFSISLRAIEP